MTSLRIRLAKGREVKNIALLVLTSDKGLAGSLKLRRP